MNNNKSSKVITGSFKRVQGRQTNTFINLKCTVCESDTHVRKDKLDEALNADCLCCLTKARAIEKDKRDQQLLSQNLTKHIVGTTLKSEGDRMRRHTVIECKLCGFQTTKRKQKQIDAALNSECSGCPRPTSLKENRRFQAQQDRALIEAYRSFRNLLPGPVDKRKTHGFCSGVNRRTYNIWKGMMARCYKSHTASFNHYGGRGITVCERWHDVANFFEDMGLAPDKYSIERHDVNGNYEPFNCSWIPMGDQGKNKRSSYVNRGIINVNEFLERKQKVIAAGAIPISDIPFTRETHNWWRENFGLYDNPYIYGPMPWKRTSDKYRKQEAIERGWFVPAKLRKNNI